MRKLEEGHITLLRWKEKDAVETNKEKMENNCFRRVVA